MKTFLKISLVAAVALLAGAFWLLSQISIETWLVSTTSAETRPIAKAFALVYLKNLGTLRNFNRSQNLPPLQFVLGGCVDRISSDEPCRQTFEWLLNKGEDINATDSTKLGFTPLHTAVVACDSAAVEYLLLKGANVNTPAAGEKFRGLTPLNLLAQLKDCSSTQQIREVLKSKGGHE